MENCAEERPSVSQIALGRSQDWVHHVISLLDAAMRQLYREEKTAEWTILKAASLLRQRIDPPAPLGPDDSRGRLLAWQARKVRNYIDTHIAEPIPVADLCALIQRSEAHFSRAFRHTFGKSPHAFVISRRVELAAQCMLESDAPLRDIALRCGFADQSHLCKQFRDAMGYTPAAWRRTRRMEEEEDRNRSPRADENAVLAC